MAVVRKDKLLAGYNGNLEHVYIDSNMTDANGETTNGIFVTVGGLHTDGGGEAVVGTLAENNEDAVLIHNSEIMYDERLSRVDQYKIKEESVARGYRLYVGDIFTLSADLFDGTVAVGDKLKTVGGKLTAGDFDSNNSASGGSGNGYSTGADEVNEVVYQIIEDCTGQLGQDANHADIVAYAVKVIKK